MAKALDTCPNCNKPHTRREEALDCLEQARKRDKPFTPEAEDARNILILTSRYYGKLPIERVVASDVKAQAQVIDWDCPYEVLCKMPNPETPIPHPSKLAICLDTVTINRRIYQCVDCLLLFTDCIVNDTPTDCKETRCVFYEDFGGRHEVMMRHLPKIQYGELVVGDSGYITRTRKTKAMSTRQMKDKLAANPKLIEALEKLARAKGLIS